MNSRKDMNKKYKSTMHIVRKQLNIFSTFLSYIIHFGPIRITLNLLDRTILRPVPLLSASVLSLIGGLGLYAVSLYNGYPMNGSEVAFLFLAGIFIGIIIDYLRIILGVEKI